MTRVAGAETRTEKPLDIMRGAKKVAVAGVAGPLPMRRETGPPMMLTSTAQVPPVPGPHPIGKRCALVIAV
ncbi:MAG TPA: hypothetical protein DHV38_00320 [Corynebacterium casei]|nr:hypothetical protein [Corynebacterium casei]